MGTGIDESKKALKRARDGQVVAWFLICFNLAVAVGVIAAMQVYGNAFPIFVIFYTAVLSSTFLLSFFDWIYRFCTCIQCYGSTSEDPLVVETNDDDKEVTSGYVDMENMGSDTDESGATDENGEACYVGEPMMVEETRPVVIDELQQHAIDDKVDEAHINAATHADIAAEATIDAEVNANSDNVVVSDEKMSTP